MEIFISQKDLGYHAHFRCYQHLREFSQSTASSSRSCQIKTGQFSKLKISDSTHLLLNLSNKKSKIKSQFKLFIKSLKLSQSAVNRAGFPSKSFAHDTFWCLNFQLAMIEQNWVSLFDNQKVLNWLDLTCKNKTDFILLQHCFRIASGDTVQSLFRWSFFFGWHFCWHIDGHIMSWHSMNCHDEKLSQCNDFHFDFGWLNIDTNEMYQSGL